MTAVKCFNAVTCSYPADYRPESLNLSSVITSTSGTTGTLLAPVAGNYLDLVLPYGIVIGDSIAEGQPIAYGKLNGNPTSVAGQPAYELSRQFGMPIINHGIGGQTTTQVRARWARDVLGQAVDPGDGRGASTLAFAHGVKPTIVFLHCGVNDACLGVMPNDTKANLAFFAQSCRDNGIKLVVDKIGCEPSHFQDSVKLARAQEVNGYLGGDFKTAYPEAAVIEYLLWSTNGTNDYLVPRSGYFADGLHMNPTGGAAYADYVAAMVSGYFLRRITLNSAVNGPQGFGRATGITFGGQSLTLPNQATQTIESPAFNKDSPEVRLVGNSFSLVTGSSVGFWGYAGINAEFQAGRLIAQANPLPVQPTTIGQIYPGVYVLPPGATITFDSVSAVLRVL